MGCAGDALVTFNYERHAVNCISDHAPSKLAAGVQVHTMCAAGPPACPQAQWQGHLSCQVNPTGPPTTAALPCLWAAVSQTTAVYLYWLWCCKPLPCSIVDLGIADHCYVPLLSQWRSLL